MSDQPWSSPMIGDVYNLLGLIFLKSPTFLDPAFPNRNIDSVFLKLNEELNAIRAELGEERLRSLLALAAATRARFEADPGDSNGEARKGRQMVREMESILLSAVQRPEYPEIDRDEMVALAQRLIKGDSTRRERDTVTDQLLVALPHANIMALLFETPDVDVEQVIDEALRREAEWRAPNAP